MNYYDLTIPFRSLLLCSLFLETCLGGCLFVVLIKRKGLFQKILAASGTVCSGILMIFYTAHARASLRSLEVPAVSERLCQISFVFPLSIVVLVFFMISYLYVKEYRYRKNSITRFAIKEGLDKLNSGLCFYQDDGRTILVNQRMNELCFAVTGKDLQNAVLFWEILRNGDVSKEIQRLSYGDNPGFRMSDGTVWTFTCEKLKDFYQLTAANTTQIQLVTDELQEKNQELSAWNLRLKMHCEKVEELTRAKERLETRAHIHSELGQALLAARYYFQEEGQEPPLDIWKQNIAMLRKEVRHIVSERPMDMLSRITEQTGISIELKGKFPVNEKIQQLFVQAAAEALTNAVSHALAKTLYIELSEDQEYYFMMICNDGIKPTGMIHEGGGLGTLRRKVEDAGGSMTVKADPEFSLNITFLKESGDM